MSEFIRENGNVILAVIAVAALMGAVMLLGGDIQDIVRGSTGA